MKPMLLAFLAIALISIGSNYALQYAGFSAEEQTSSTAVRLDQTKE